ncbi:hypothetical protein ACCS53_39495, partial [Rhizobium ruizarguesonis]
TLEEQVSLLSGADFWTTVPVERHLVENGIDHANLPFNGIRALRSTGRACPGNSYGGGINFSARQTVLKPTDYSVFL